MFCTGFSMVTILESPAFPPIQRKAHVYMYQHHNRTHTYQPKVFYGDPALSRRYGDPYTQWFMRTKKNQEVVWFYTDVAETDRSYNTFLIENPKYCLILLQELNSRLSKLFGYCFCIPTSRGPDPQFTCNSKLC